MNIKIFTTQNCAYCKKVKEFLLNNNLRFNEVLLDNDRNAQNEMIALTGQYSVPVTVFEKEGKQSILLGFDPKKIQESIDFLV